MKELTLEMTIMQLVFNENVSRTSEAELSLTIKMKLSWRKLRTHSFIVIGAEKFLYMRVMQHKVKLCQERSWPNGSVCQLFFCVQRPSKANALCSIGVRPSVIHIVVKSLWLNIFCCFCLQV